jgi:hypothetical protein
MDIGIVVLICNAVFFYPRRRENPYFSLKEKSLVARASDSETATKPL